MDLTWKRPGLRAAVLYALAIAVLGTVVSHVCRLVITRRSVPSGRLPEGPVIVVANHTSVADGVLLALVGRRLGRSLRMMATGGVFRAAVLGPLLRVLGFIPVLRGTTSAAGALDAAADALAAGEAVALFPEGRITRDPARWPERSKTGAVRLALRTGAPIVPVAMVGVHDVVESHQPARLVARLARNVFARPMVEVAVGEPIDVRRLAGVAGLESASEETIRRVADDVMAVLVEQVAELRGEPAPYAVGAPRVAA